MNEIGRTDKKKLSWIYRKKTKLQKSKSTQNVTDNVDENKKPRIIVRNIPFKVNAFFIV